MILTLHRYIFGELLRVAVLTTAALSLILSLGLVLQPIQQFDVPPRQALSLLAYLLPVTLTFVLPMSVLFAATLVYGRFASDNELDACKASGVSMVSLTYPGFFLAVTVAITTLVLSFYVTPVFVGRTERSLKANAKQILFRNLQRKGYYTLPGRDYIIRADRVIAGEDTLEDVIILQSRDADITRMVIAERAKILFDSAGPFNRVTVAAYNTRQIDDTHSRSDVGDLGYISISSTFPSLLSDNIKFQKIEQLKRIRRDMMEFYPVYELAMQGRSQLAAEMLAEDMKAAGGTSEHGYYELVTEDRLTMLRADSYTVDRDARIELSGSIRLVELDKTTHKLICQWDCQKGRLAMQDNTEGTKLELMLVSPSWVREKDQKGISDLHIVKNIELPKSILSRLGADGLIRTIASVDTEGSVLKAPASQWLSQLKKDLHNRIVSTSNEITSETNSRLVLGLGSIVLILIGIALGIRYRGGHILSAFGISSIPACFLVVFIMTGKQLTRNPATPAISGPVVMWTGLVVLTVFTLHLYRKLLWI